MAGYVKTVRGRSGGLRLALAPEQIRVGEVIRHTEATMALVECFNPQGRCRIEAACGLRLILKEAFGAFLRTLDGYTLADVIAHRREALSRALAS